MADKEKKSKKKSKGLIVRAFGPFADAFGSEIAKLPPAATANLAKLGEKFRKKAEALDESTMSARLFRQVLDEAAWAEEEIVAEYLSGVLATSSKSIISDRGVAITALIRRMSSLELRAHYVLYAELLRAGRDTPLIDLRFKRNTVRLHCELDLDEFFGALEIPDSTADERRQVLDHVILGLAREDLIDNEGWWYSVEGPSASNRVYFHPSPLGAELFLWGLGSAVIDQAQFFDPGLELLVSDDIPRLSLTTLGDLDEEVEVEEMALQEELRRRDIVAVRDRASQLVASRPDLPNGYFYLALCAALDGDSVAVSFAKESSLRAKANHLMMGLITIDSTAIQFPSAKDRLDEVARVLESSTWE